MIQVLFIVLLTGMAVFLILLVLVQRGRGGGLSGAFGGAGGQSAFGAKAGDTFTKITMWTAFVWIVLCTVAALILPKQQNSKLDGVGTKANTTEAESGAGAGTTSEIGPITTPEEEDVTPDEPTTTGPPGTINSSGQLETPDTDAPGEE